jgi:superfamily II DNA/RNA helicase
VLRSSDFSHAPCSVTSVVLDEADRLLEMGFVEQVDAILEHFIHDGVQRAMFSATMPQGIAEMAESILRDPVHISVGKVGAGTAHDQPGLLHATRGCARPAVVCATLQLCAP